MNSRDFLSTLMAPSNLLMNKLQLTTKLLGLCVLFLLPIVILTTYRIHSSNALVQSTVDEIDGAALVGDALDVLIQTQKHRGQMNLLFAGQSAVEQPLAETRAALKSALAQLNSSIDSHPKYGLGTNWKPTRELLEQFSEGKVPATAAESFKLHTDLIAASASFANLAAEKSGMLLDPEAAPRLWVDMSVQKSFIWIETLAQLRGQGAALIKAGTADSKQQGAIQSKLDALQGAINAVTNQIAALQRANQVQATSLQVALEATSAFSSLARTDLLGEQVSGDPSAYFAQGTQAIEKALSYQKYAKQALSQLLMTRKTQVERKLSIDLAVAIVFSLVLLYFSFGFYCNLMDALRSMQRNVSITASGDLSHVLQISGTDEVAQTGKILATMSTSLSGMVANIRSNSVMVSQLGKSLWTELSDLSSRTVQQATSLEQTTVSVSELAETVKKNADSTSAVNNLASNVRIIAESSNDTMQLAVESMKGIQVSALKVQDIVSVIDSIAFQTNILALNAAVEAARAGEQGRGFAVVATEVRNLAQRSASSAKQIKSLIEDSVEKVGSGVMQIGLVNTTLDEIVVGIRELAVNVSAISSATGEQSRGLEQISLALRHLDDLTQSNGKMAEGALATAAGVDQRAATLAQSVASFKLGQGTADEAFLLVKKAMQVCAEKGRGALEVITTNADQAFSDRDMYVFVFDRQGRYRAFAGNRAKLDVNLLHVPGLDGKKLVDDAFKIASTGGGWVDYQITNPATQKMEAKASYVESISEQMVIGCGVYKST